MNADRWVVVGLLVGIVSCGGDSTTPPDPVASIVIGAQTATIVVGGRIQLTAATEDASGKLLGGPTILWLSNDPTIASVSSGGLVTGLSVGTATITATSEGKSGTSQLTVVNPVETGISDPVSFVSRCPNNDPVYSTLRQDFELRGDGELITTDPTCVEPYTTSSLSDELLAMQTLRMLYYMSQGTAGRLPWTPLPLYEWMKSEVAGVDLRTQQGLSSCCEIINGKKYFITSRKNSVSLAFYHDWIGVSDWLTLFAHEARHADGPGHVTGCPAFPSPNDAAGCDATYDPANISSYGIQYWLFAAWATGYLDVGFGCLPRATALQYAQSAAASANVYPARFVSNAPPIVIATVVYGSHCSQR